MVTNVRFSPMFTCGLFLSNAAAYVLVPNLSWPNTRFTGFAPRESDSPVREVLNAAVRDLANGILTGPETKGERSRDGREKQQMLYDHGRT